MDLRNEIIERFTRRLLATPGGRAHVLNQIADAESNGENQVFEHILEHVDDPQLRKLVEKHQADEIRHEQLFRACVERNGIVPGPVPSHLKLIDRLDRATGGFFEHDLDKQTGVMEAYLLLQVIEERAITQFQVFEKLFREIDPVIADTFLEVARDEERHLKYCHAISKRYAPDEITRQAALKRLRELEARCFAENSAANMEHVFASGFFDGGPLARWVFKTMQSLGNRRGELPYTRYAGGLEGAPCGAGGLTMRTNLFASAILLAAGCTVANPEAVVGLDEPVVIYAHGAAPGSEIVVHRQGALDPDGHQQSVTVRDARVTIDAAGDKVRLQALTLTLDDTDLPPTPQMPDGLKLRAQSLSIAQPMTANVRARGAVVLALSLTGSMRYSTGMQLDDGTVYPLGPSDASGEFQLTVARAADGTLKVRLDSQPDGRCADVGDLLTLSDCAMTIELATALAEPR